MDAVEKVVLPRFRADTFDLPLNVRVSPQIKAVLAYWTARYPKGHLRHYSSAGHFVRAAIIHFDRVQRKLESGEIESLV